MQPSPNGRRVGIRTSTFEACSGFTHVTARRIAQPPKAAFVTRLRSGWLPTQTARQLPEQSTTLWVDPPSTGETRPRGALQNLRILHRFAGRYRPRPLFWIGTDAGPTALSATARPLPTRMIRCSL